MGAGGPAAVSTRGSGFCGAAGRHRADGRARSVRHCAGCRCAPVGAARGQCRGGRGQRDQPALHRQRAVPRRGACRRRGAVSAAAPPGQGGCRGRRLLCRGGGAARGRHLLHRPARRRPGRGAQAGAGGDARDRDGDDLLPRAAPAAGRQPDGRSARDGAGGRRSSAPPSPSARCSGSRPADSTSALSPSARSPSPSPSSGRVPLR